MPFTLQETQHYLRHFSLKEIGMAGQEKLKNSRVLCIGAGGLGSPALLYLAAAGIGTLGIVDPDCVDVTNLQRQVLYTEDDLQSPKVTLAKQKLSRLNPHITLIAHHTALTEQNALQLINDYDIIVDGTDNFATRYIVNDACMQLKKPNVFGSIAEFEGQCTIFCTEGGPCYRCIFPAPPPAGLIPNCAEAGVLGVLPGLIGTLQATEVIKFILQIGEPLIGRLLQVNALNMEFRHFKLQKNVRCVLCSHQQNFYSVSRKIVACDASTTASIPQISAQQLKQLQQTKEPFFLLDVREDYEYEICNLGGHHIPLNQLVTRLSEIAPDKTVIVHCKGGPRSERAVQLLQQHGFKNVMSLTGGILAWIEQIDPSLSRY